MDLILFSNSTNHGMKFLEHAWDEVAEFLEGIEEVLFIPFAGADHDQYTEHVTAALGQHGVKVTGLHAIALGERAAAVSAARAIFTGGGNTFRLLRSLQEMDILDALRTAVQSGTPYMGASAGTNIIAPTIRTTNDMPIVEPTSFVALGCLPFQINAHYLDTDPGSTHAGETREARLLEFLEENDVAALGLREGTHLRVRTAGESSSGEIRGTAVASGAPGPAVLFQRAEQPTEIEGDVTRLLHLSPVFDSAR